MRCMAIGLALILSGGALWGGALTDELSAHELKQVERGIQITKLIDVPGKPWPQVSVYYLVRAQPSEVIGIFTDYNEAKAFVPNVYRSVISKQISPTTQEVDYSIKVPIFPDEHYRTRNCLSALSGGGYEVEWKLLKAEQTRESEGSFRAEPYPGGSLVRYRSLTTPNSSMATLLKGVAIDQMKKTVSAICDRISKIKKSDPSKLAEESARVEAATD